ncbi:MAG: UDP-N-acetylmuramoyl-L-alanine--D-glutamate ligase [Coriobacteriales bacterium]|jgi:UDP-N-acetylmuramoylalanine--D-glutamate ligase
MPEYKVDKVVVVGLGKTGLAAARFCLDHLADNPRKRSDIATINSFTVYGGPSSEDSEAKAKPFRDAGIDVFFDTEEIQGHYDLAVISPGISVHSDFYKSAQAAADEVISGPEFAFRISPKRWIGITGTNGKTTTTTLITELLESAGMVARPSGNIGLPCIEVIRSRLSTDFIVAELSSFQLASMPTFKPIVAILLNITPDHVEWHGTLEEYARAKANIFANQGPEDFAVVDCTAEQTRNIAKALIDDGHSVVCVGGPEGLEQEYYPEPSGSVVPEHRGSAFVENGVLTVVIDGARHELANKDDMKIKGNHNIQNALCSSAAAVICRAADSDIISGLKKYTSMPHRVEFCGQVGNTKFYNDSKATNTDAASKALTAFEDDDVVILLGGHDKQTDLSGLVSDCLAKCKAVVCFGEARERFLAEFAKAKADSDSNCEILSAKNLEEAFDVAVEASSDGDVILLSPACSSFDEFSSYEERGDAFKALVRQRISN